MKNKKPEEKKDNDNAKIDRILPRGIVEEMKSSYIDYAMSVIVSRALPDVRDGLKPVHRRILYVMLEDGLRNSARFRKSANVVGLTLARYHPHGDSAVYDSLVRMAQDFSLRYPLVQGQGNFGCFTKDTKVRICDGRNLSFAELIKEKKQGKKHWTLAFNHQDKKIEVAEIKNPRLTRQNERIIETTLDNGEKIRSTLDHLFMLRDGSYKEARDLKPGDSLMPLYEGFYNGKDKNLKEYQTVFQPVQNSWEFVHHLADKWNLENNVYKKSAGRIRHHKDFNKLNNNPENVLRVQWQDHWKYHKEIASERHKNNPEYVKKIAEGRRKFIEKNRHIFSLRAKKLNKKLWADPFFRKRHTEKIKKMWENPEYKERMRTISRKNIKALWQRKDFQELMSKIKSQELKKRWQDENYRKVMVESIRISSLKLWSSAQHREHISKTMKERAKDPSWRKRQSAISKALWKDPEYRAKYPKDHFSKMAKKQWENPVLRESQRVKTIRQWQNTEFREKVIKAVKIRNKQRLEENPNLMKELAQKSKISLRRNWQNPEYKEKVIKSKILGYVCFLLDKHQKITPQIYEKERYNNCIPKLENALNYFRDFPGVLTEAKKRNHKVVRTRILKKREDVYDLTIDKWHNFALSAGIFVHNSTDHDPPAAARYTEARLSKLGEEMLSDIEKNTVDFGDNYDGTRKEPRVLPSPVPQLVLNGSLGIAVGMMTNIPPHNLSEVCDALIYLADNPKSTTEDIFKFIKGPDFPTGGIIFGKKDIIAAYSQGKGQIVTRGKAEIAEEKSGRQQLIITEIPYQVQKSGMVEHFAKLVREKKIEGIKDIRDESDKEGTRIVFDFQRDAFPQRVLNKLYKFTDLQKTFHLNMIALVDGIQPKVLSLVDVLNYFIVHRKEVITRRAKYELEKAKERAHILEGLNKCLSKIDDVIKTIKESKDREDALKNLIKKFKLSEMQANAILETKLSALAKLERKKIEEELKAILIKIEDLADLLKSPARIKAVFKKETLEIKRKFGDERKTRVSVEQVGQIADEDLIPQEETIITLTQGGYIKRINPNTYKIQKRGGKGILGMKTLQDDIVEHFLLAKTHDFLLFFTDTGKVFRNMVYEIPEGTRVARGRGLLNFIDIAPQDRVLSIMALSKEEFESGNLIMVTQNGIIKKTKLSDFKNVRKNGLIAITMRKDDLLTKVGRAAGKDEVILITRKGQSVRFKESDIREMGRTASGVKGIGLKKGDKVAGAGIISADESEKQEKHLLVLSENGFGKRTNIKEYRLQKRAGSGIKAGKITPKTGELCASVVLNGKEEELIVISQRGQIIRTQISSIPKLSRATQGVKIIRLDEKDKVSSIICI